MTMWPGLHYSQLYNEWYGHYVEDRVAFREDVVRLYMDGTYLLFGEFSEDMHMFAKDGHIFPASEGYISSYQHLATDEQLIDQLVTYLDRTNHYLTSKGIPFVFMAGLDKKSVYPQYMPDYLQVDESKEGIMEMLSRKLSERNVPYIIPIQEFREQSKVEQIYNTKYDSVHWNALGRMYGMELLTQKYQELGADVPSLDRNHYDLTYEDKVVEFISFPIMDTVPIYQLKASEAALVYQDDAPVTGLPTLPGTNILHMVNMGADSDKTIFVMHDSFFEGKYEYFSSQYRDVYMVPRQNYENMKIYIDALKPDVVLFENAERSFVDDLYAYVNLANVIYE